MRNFRINTVAAGTDEDASAEREAMTMSRMKGGRSGHGVTAARPKDKRQACKGKRNPAKVSRWQWAA